jgi:hypothetical protein
MYKIIIAGNKFRVNKRMTTEEICKKIEKKSKNKKCTISAEYIGNSTLKIRDISDLQEIKVKFDD